MHSVELQDVTLAFGEGPTRALALNSVDLNLRGGFFTVIAGPSGSGKTSLLSVVGALLAPDSGRVLFDGTDITRLDLGGRTKFRREQIGYVFQLFRLMRALNAEQNVRLSLEIRRAGQSRQRALEALEIVGLSNKAHLLPNQLSGGEQQRVAIARAIAHRPAIVLADEPTASLDTENGLLVTRMLAEMSQQGDRIVVAVTHDPRVLPFARRIVEIRDGRIVKG